MKRRIAITLLLAAISYLTVSETVIGQEQQIQFAAISSENHRASEIAWTGHFGGRKDEPHNIYCLMMQGGFLAPTSDDFAKLIKDWFSAHEKAEVKVVYVLSPALTDFPDSKWKSVWVFDASENLNLYLVRSGGCPAGTMLLNQGDKTSLSKEEYESFAQEVMAAEKLAKAEKLGMWK